MRRKSTARGSAENVRTLLEAMGHPLGRRNLHINFPGGAPVDGPSAGAAMALAALSAMTGRPVDGSSAITGEITVQGRVRAVGGVPEKVAAAKRAGLRRVCIPEENAQEAAHITGIEIIAVTELAEVLSCMLLESEAARAPASAGRAGEMLAAAPAAAASAGAKADGII